MKINYKIKQTGFYKTLFPDSENLSNQQLNWMNDPNKCPACGHNLETDDAECPECKLRLKPNNYTKPLDISKYKDNSVKYTYKPNNQSK